MHHLADVHWGDANIGIIDWAAVRKLGNEYIAQRGVTYSGLPMDAATQMRAHIRSVRTYRQIASVLRSQGLSEQSDAFSYRAQVLQRRVLRVQGHLGRAFGSRLLDLISGYGYRPLRGFATYLLVVFGFAALYYFAFATSVHPQLSIHDAIVFSLTSFHGRGFSPSPNGAVTLHDPLTTFAAVEAVIGLLIEITFIATFTQRFFAR